MPSSFTELEQNRIAAGLSVTSLCASAGIARSTWLRWRRATHKPNGKAVDKVIRAFARARDRTPPPGRVRHLVLKLDILIGHKFAIYCTVEALRADGCDKPMMSTAHGLGLSKQRISQIHKEVAELRRKSPHITAMTNEFITRIGQGEFDG